MILNLIETLRTSIYNPKHTQNTQIIFGNYKNMLGNTYVQKRSFEDSACYAGLYGTINIVEGHMA